MNPQPHNHFKIPPTHYPHFSRAGGSLVRRLGHLEWRRTKRATAETTPAPSSTPAIATPLPGVPVEVGGDVLFYVRERLGSLTASDRAALIEQRINRLANDPFGTPVDLTAVESPDGIDIMNGGEIILTITQRDLAAAGLDEDIGVVAGAVIQAIRMRYAHA